MDEPLAFSYVRFSSAVQAQGDSLRRQRQLSKDYAERHGLRLADLDLTDTGISAFKGKNATEGALKGFLDAVNEGRIPAGSFLLIEQLDRLSRADVWTAFSLLSSIVNAGITVVTVADGMKYSKESASNNFADLIIAISSMIKANAESVDKGRRVHAAWSQKRKNAHQEKLTVLCPNWMRLSDDRKEFILHDDHVLTVKRIFDMAINGKGVRVITSILNKEKVKTYGRSDHWAESTVKKILKTRTVLGEYLPCRKIDGRQVPEGEAVQGYYPQIIDEQTFNLAQVAIASRQQGSAGRKGANMTNLFSGLVRCGYCGGTMRYLDKGKPPKGGKYLVCMNSQNGMGCVSKNWRYEAFETVFLLWVRELDVRSLLQGAKSGSEANAIRQSIVALNEKIKHQDGLIRDYLIKAEETPELFDIFTSRMLEIRKAQNATKEERKALDARLTVITRDGSEVSEEEQAAMVAAFQGGAGDRFALASRIRSIVERIDMFRVGTESKVDEVTNDPAVLDYVAKHSAFRDPYFVIKFKNGDVQIATPDPENPSKLAHSAKAGSDRHVIIHEEEIFGDNRNSNDQSH